MGCASAKAGEPERTGVVAGLPEPSRAEAKPTLIAQPELFGPETNAKLAGQTASSLMWMENAMAEHVEFSAEELDFLKEGVFTYLERVAKKGSEPCRRAYTKLDIENISGYGKNKPFKTEGYTQELTEGKFGIACRKGSKPRAPNQDSWTVLECGEEFSIIIVCDGNGNDGHVFSNQACDLLPKYLFRSTKFKENFQNFKICVIEAFESTNEMLRKLALRDGLDIEHSGTTATLVMYKRQSKCLWLAHVGNCGVISINNAGTAKSLIEDHHPQVEEEAQRVQKAGGRIEFDGYANYRIYAKDNWLPGSIVTRLLGNIYGQRTCGITCQPSVKQIQLTSADRVIAVGTDGLWTFVKPESVANLCPPGVSLENAVTDLADLAWRSWVEQDENSCVDDITAILFKPIDQP